MCGDRNLKPQQLNAIKLLAMGTPVNQVADLLQVSTMTIFRWKKLPEFNSKLNTINTSGLEEVAKKLNILSLTAVETLQEILCDMTQPAALRVKASLGVLGAMGAVNNALEKGLQHNMADFDLSKRWDGIAYSYNASGNAIPMSGEMAGHLL